MPPPLNMLALLNLLPPISFLPPSPLPPAPCPLHSCPTPHPGSTHHGPAAECVVHECPERFAVNVSVTGSPQSSDDLLYILNVLNQQHPETPTQQKGVRLSKQNEDGGRQTWAMHVFGGGRVKETGSLPPGIRGQGPEGAGGQRRQGAEQPSER